MKLPRLTVFASLCAALVAGGTSRADTKVEVKGVHLCCPACVGAVKAIGAKLEGTKLVCDTKKMTVTITAADNDAAQKAVDALAAGGFHGETDSADVKVKDDSGVKKGKVATLTLSGIHDCCGRCNIAIKKAVKKVDGVTADTAKPKAESFTVSGDFDAEELVKALNAAGFHVKVKE